MKPRRAAFTLFELILAIALAAVLLTLIGTAINLYLMRVDTDRTRVEEAQLARSVLTMITDDIRATTVYQKQDTSAIAALMAAGTPFDVDSIDKARETSGSAGAPGSAGALANLSSQGGASASSGASSSAGASASSSASEEESEDTMPLGLTGFTDELYVDATRLPRQEELFTTVTGYTNAPSAATSNPGASGNSTAGAEVNPPADLKTVHYYVRPGPAIEAGSVAATSLAPDAQAAAGGLVREEVPRGMRVFAEQSGDIGALDSGTVLIAPEVTQIQFRYYDGSQLTEEWDMKELKKLPIAIEVCIRLRSARAATAATAAAEYNTADAMNATRTYRQVVYLPMSQASESSAAASAEASSESSTTDSSSASSSSPSGSGSAFGNE